MRHARKSERRRFDGHKAHLAVDPESQLITAAEVLAGNAADHERAFQLVEQSEANAEAVVEEVVEIAPTGTATPGRPSPRPDAISWRRSPVGAEEARSFQRKTS